MSGRAHTAGQGLAPAEGGHKGKVRHGAVWQLRGKTSGQPTTGAERKHQLPVPGASVPIDDSINACLPLCASNSNPSQLHILALLVYIFLFMQRFLGHHLLTVSHGYVRGCSRVALNSLAVNFRQHGVGKMLTLA